MMRIGFDVTSAAKRRRRGIGAYVERFLAALPLAAPRVAATLFLRDRRAFRTNLVADLLPAAPRRRLLGPLPPPVVSMRGLDAFHGLGVHLPARPRVPASFTLHDLRGLDGLEWSEPAWARRRAARIRETVGRADRIVTDSEHGRQRLLHHFPDFPAERVRAVHLGVDHTHFRVPAPERVAATKARLGLKRPFLLQVGLLDRHKNPETSLAAFADSCARAEGWELVFAGGEAGDQRRILEERARALGVADSVRLLGGVSGAELPQLYAAAGLLLFPSWYEGFGLPVLEAMACGTAGVASSACGIPEIAAAAWPLADPAAPEAFAAAVDRLLQSPDRIDAARRSGLGHAARFTWERCVKETIGFLELGSDNG